MRVEAAKQLIPNKNHTVHIDPLIIQKQLRARQYLADTSLCTVIACARLLGRPILLEGEPGVGKTSLAKALAASNQSHLHRLQCHQTLGLDDSCYEWDSAAQLLAVQQADGKSIDVYARQFLLQRPLLAALEDPGSVLLIDELDRAEESFEALLLEYLGEWQLSIPQLGTINTQSPPLVIITANGERPLSDALRRRCLYHFMAYPSETLALEILSLHSPSLNKYIRGNCNTIVQALRQMPLEKVPGVAEGIDMIAALQHLGIEDFSQNPEESIRQLLPTVIKTSRDWRLIDQATLADLALAVQMSAQTAANL